MVPKWFMTLSLWINAITPIHFMAAATAYATFLYFLGHWHPALAFFFTMVAVLVVVLALKLITRVPRPVDCMVLTEHPLRAFPSGHVSSAAFAATMVTHTFPYSAPGVEMLALGVVLFALTLVVALSRLTLRAHTLTQVGAGFVLGVGIPLFVIWIVDPAVTAQVLNML